MQTYSVEIEWHGFSDDFVQFPGIWISWGKYYLVLALISFTDINTIRLEKHSINSNLFSWNQATWLFRWFCTIFRHLVQLGSNSSSWRILDTSVTDKHLSVMDKHLSVTDKCLSVTGVFTIRKKMRNIIHGYNGYPWNFYGCFVWRSYFLSVSVFKSTDIIKIRYGYG